MRRYHTAASGKSAGKLVLCGARVFCRNGGAAAHHSVDLVKEVSRNTFTPISDLTKDDIELYQEMNSSHGSLNDDSNDFVVEKTREQVVKVWRNEAGRVHRDGDKPAMIYADGTQAWFQDGQLSRGDDKPAMIYADGSQEWFVNGKHGRDGDQPAIVTATGEKSWLKDGRFSRENDKPTVITEDGTQFWYRTGSKLGILHREGGKPAIITANGKKAYYVDGRRVPAP